MTQQRQPMRWRIASAYLSLLLASLALLTLAGLLQLRAIYLSTLEAGVTGQARLLAAFVEPELRGRIDPDILDQLVHDAHAQLDARVSVIAPDGTMLADSLEAPGSNVLTRPEVSTALSNGHGANERESTATGDDRLYVAVPVSGDTGPIGVVRIGVALSAIAEAQTRLALAVLITALVAAAIAVALAILIARRTTQPLLDLRVMVGRIAAGDLQVQVPIPADEEIAALAEDFNQMASRLRDLVQTLETERQRLATIQATMADGILIVAPDDTIMLANQSACVLLPSIAHPHQPLAHSGSTALSDAVREARSGTPGTLPLVLEDLDVWGERSLRAVVTPLPPPEDDQTLIVLQDLTSLRQVERSRRTLLSNIAHDLRTPLTSLQAIIETLQDGALEEADAAHDFLRRMADEVQGMTRLVNEVLELARIESGELALQRAPTDILTLLQHTAKRMQAQAEHRHLSLRLDLPVSVPPLMLDAVRIEQALLNVIQNAITFTPPGGSIVLGTEVRTEDILIWVRDTGVGIAPKDLPYIFERAYKADRSRTGRGAGLGLAIVKHLIERHGGRVRVESQLQAGTTIVIVLPLTQIREQDPSVLD